MPCKFEMVPRRRLVSSGDGRYLACWGRDTPLTIWDRSAAPDAELISIKRGSLEWPLICTPDNLSILVGGASCVSEVDLATGATKRTIQLPTQGDGKAAVHAAAFSPDGQTLFVSDGEGRICEFDWNDGAL